MLKSMVEPASLRLHVLDFLQQSPTQPEVSAARKRTRLSRLDGGLAQEPQDEEDLALLLVNVEASAASDGAPTSDRLHTILERVRSMHESCELRARKLVSACEAEALRRGLNAPLLVAWSLHELGIMPMRTWLEDPRASWADALRGLYQRTQAAEASPLDDSLLDAVCLQLVSGASDEGTAAPAQRQCEGVLRAFCAPGGEAAG